MIAHAMAALMLSVLFAACSTNTSPSVSQPPPVVGKPITSDTLHGALAGYLVQGKTYYMDSDVIIPAGDTLLMQPGVTVIVMNGPAYYPEFQQFGTLISYGTAAQPNTITVWPNYPGGPPQKTYANLTVGLWGGIQCSATSGDLILKFTHLEFAGGSGTAVGSAKSPYVIYFESPNANFICEDSWITGSSDDPVRVATGRVSIFRNVMECCSGGPANPSGDGWNCKAGTTGDIAYNLNIGNCTNGPKTSNKGTAPYETNVNIYNNTIITCGWRYVGTGRAGSIDIEQGARGTVYNNIVVNCFTGFRLVDNPVADTANTFYDYNWYYANDSTAFSNVYPHDGVSCQVPKPHDVAPSASGGVDPMFVGYSPATAVPVADFVYPSVVTNQPPIENVEICSPTRFTDRSENFSSNFNLAPGSKAIGTAYTATAPQASLPAGVTIPYTGVGQVTSIYSATNPYGAKQTGLGKDFGAYQTDGSGNIH